MSEKIIFQVFEKEEGGYGAGATLDKTIDFLAVVDGVVRAYIQQYGGAQESLMDIFTVVTERAYEELEGTM